MNPKRDRHPSIHPSMDGCLSKRTRQKELKRCHTAAAESLSHPSPIHKVTSQPIAANPLWSSYPDAAEKRGSAAVKAFFFFFFTSIFREQADAVTHRERASVRECVTAAGVWPSPTNERHQKRRAAALLMGSWMPAYRAHRPQSCRSR